MAELFRRLKDPQLVADFQQKCGILPRKPTSSNGNSSRAGQSRVDVINISASRHITAHTTENSPIRVNDTEINGNDEFPRKRIINENGFHRNVSETSLAESNSVSSESSDEEISQNEYIITNKLLHYMFEFGASLGNELFYITFFPFWFWNVDGYVGRRACIFWAVFMYLGQAAKDIIKWPRPASPPVFRLEQRYALEYGMPSTHAMVGAGLPFSLFILTVERYEYPYMLGLAGCIIWCSLVCGSRLYLGMHTVLDVLAGLVFVFLLMIIMFPFLDSIDHFILTNSYAPIFCILVPLVFAVCYPTLDKWSTARGDTTLILAVTGGVSLGHWFCYQYGFMQRATTMPPFEIIYPTWQYFGQMLMRLAVGVVILIATRTIGKLLSYYFMCYLMRVSKEDMQAHKKLSIELPYKFITYFVVAINSVWVAPQVFRYLGIERPTYFTEI